MLILSLASNLFSKPCSPSEYSFKIDCYAVVFYTIKSIDFNLNELELFRENVIGNRISE